MIDYLLTGFTDLTKGELQQFIIVAPIEKVGRKAVRQIQFNNMLDEFISHQSESNRERLRYNLKNFLKALWEQSEKDQVTFMELLDRELDQDLAIEDIDRSQRQTIKENLQCYILGYIKQIDPQGYKNIITAKEIHRLSRQVEDLFSLVRQVENYQRERQIYIDKAVLRSQESIHIDNADCLDKRKNEIRRIGRCFESGQNVVFLYGEPGIGKTTLAKMYANQSEKKNIYFAAYEGNFQQTIENLDVQGKLSGEKIIEYWSTCSQEEKRNSIIIIDNFNDNKADSSDEHLYTEALEDKFYKNLEMLGIPILITTRINVGHNAQPVGAVEDAYALFKKCCKKIEDEEEPVIREIIHTVHDNTLLVVLSAHLWEEDRTCGHRLLERLKECRVKEDGTRIITEADIPERSIKRTIYAQIEAMLDFSQIMSHSAYVSVLAHAALLPIEGITKKEFCDLLGMQYENDINDLRDRSWILGEDQRVLMHPVIREIVRSKRIIRYEECRTYCENINRMLSSGSFEKKLRYKKCADEIFKVFNVEKDIVLLNLFYNLSDVYDGLGEKVMSRKVADRVLGMLELLNDVDVWQRIDKARKYSGIAYSRYNNANSWEELEAAALLLERAQDEIQSVPKEYHNEREYIAALGRIYSNSGSEGQAKGKYLAEIKGKEYFELACVRHQKALDYRKERLADMQLHQAEERSIRQMKAEIATSYTTVATDYYYLKRFNEAIEEHKKALKLRKELENANGALINEERIIGCVIEQYKKSLEIDVRNIKLALGFYPEVIETGYAYGKYQVAEELLKRLEVLETMIMMDRRCKGKGLRKKLKKKKEEVKEYFSQLK